MRSIVHVFLLVITMSACALDPAKDPSAAGAKADPATVENGDTSPASSPEATAEESLSSSSSAIVPATGCAHVEICDAAGSTGTICVQDGCTLSQAKAECQFSDIPALGCQFHCPAIIKKLGGGTSSMCCPGVCSPGCPC